MTKRKKTVALKSKPVARISENSQEQALRLRAELADIVAKVEAGADPRIAFGDIDWLDAAWTNDNPPPTREEALRLSLDFYRLATPCDCEDGPHYEDDGETISRRFAACRTCVTRLWEAGNTEEGAKKSRTAQLAKLDAEFPDMDARNRRRGGKNSWRESLDLMPPNMPWPEREVLHHRNRPFKFSLDHYPVPRRCKDIVGLTVIHNSRFVPGKTGNEDAPDFSPVEASHQVAAGRAIWFIDFDEYGNVNGQPYLRRGMFWGEVGDKQCLVIADEYGARPKELYGSEASFGYFSQADADRLLGKDAPLLEAMAGYVIADRWIIQRADDCTEPSKPGVLFVLIDLTLDESE